MNDTCFHKRILHHQSRALDRGFNLWPLVIRVPMILVTSGGTYRVGSHHSFPEESVRIKRDDKKAKRCCLVIPWSSNTHYSASEEFHWTWATFIKFIILRIFFFISMYLKSFGLLTVLLHFYGFNSFYFQIGINKYKLDKRSPICPHVVKQTCWTI